MSAPENELTRLIKPRTLPGEALVIDANEAERAALAQQFGVTAIPALTARVTFEPKDGAVQVEGQLMATIQQPCAVSREDITYDVSEPLSLRFVPAGSGREYAPDEEVELTAEDLDEIEYHGDAFDIGEAIAQTLALAIDPYREGPDADRVRKEKGIESDDQQKPSGPLAEALAGLKKG